MAREKVKAGMVQINNSFAGQNYLPLSLGFLQAYAKKHSSAYNDFDFATPLYKRLPVEDAVAKLRGKNIHFFSSYVWNHNISTKIAERVKEEDPNATIVFGGCHVPDRNLEGFLKKYTFIDIAAVGEGEKVFTAILDNYDNRDWRKVPSIMFRERDKFVTTITPETKSDLRIGNLNDVPSPYLEGFFEPLMRENPDENWIGLLETNRGCPFSCTYCDWGVGAKKRLKDYELERVFGEIDWFSKNKVEFVYCCDANFGMFKDRDPAITKKFAENKAMHGYPKAFSVQNTKNSTEVSYDIQCQLTKSGLSKGVLLAFQTLNPDSLKAIKRHNIKLETFFELQRRFTADGVETFSDMILGLPEETYSSFTEGISQLMERGQHNRIQFNNLSILPNAEMGDPLYQQKYGLITVPSKIHNIHGSLGEWENDVNEEQQLVVGTRAMPREDWVKTRAFCYMTSLLHFDKLFQIPNILAYNKFGVKYKEMVDLFMEQQDRTKTPLLTDLSNFFLDKARDVQQGGSEYCESREWLSMLWPADEYALIDLTTKGKLPQFYDEAGRTLDSFLDSKGITGHKKVFADAITLNQELLKRPFQTTDAEVTLNHNIWEAYRAAMIGKNVPLVEGEKKYIIDRTSEKWDTLDKWLREVIWYSHKKGAYVYNCKSPGTPQETLVETPSLAKGTLLPAELRVFK